MFSIISKIFDWILSFFGNIFSSFTLRDQNAFLQTKLTETQKELAPFKERSAESETENIQLRTRIANLEQENNRLQEQLRIDAVSDNLDENAVKVLKVLAVNGGELNLWELEDISQLSKIQFDTSLNFLEHHSFIESRLVSAAKLPNYKLTQKGRKFALDKGLV